MIVNLMLSKWVPMSLFVIAISIPYFYELPPIPTLIMGCLFGSAAGILEAQTEHKIKMKILEGGR